MSQSLGSEEVTLPATSYIPASISSHLSDLHAGTSYAHYSAIPSGITPNPTSASDADSSRGTPVILGVDEAGRGPVIGPMVYGIAYLPISLHHSLLADTHHFNDSKQLTPLVRATLMRTLCTGSPTSDLREHVGWAINSLSARDISAGMLKAGGAYNLNAQAMDATIELIRGVIERGVNVAEIYVDTIGQPGTYQRKLAAVFPTCKVVVEKKADSLFPVVSAASVVAKVSRDVSCEVLYRGVVDARLEEERQKWRAEGVMEVEDGEEDAGWGSGYPSDARCVNWMKGDMDEMFGWGSECRFSWGTAKDMLEEKGAAVQVEWADDEDTENAKLSQYFGVAGADLRGGAKSEEGELRNWFGTRVEVEMKDGL